MTVKVEHGVPLPLARNQCKYPYARLGVGDSFFVPDGDQRAIASQAWRWGLKLEQRFVTRKRPGGVRVWRMS